MLIKSSSHDPNNTIQLRDILENQITREDRITVAQAKASFFTRPLSELLRAGSPPHRGAPRARLSFRRRRRRLGGAVLGAGPPPSSSLKLDGRRRADAGISPAARRGAGVPACTRARVGGRAQGDREGLLGAPRCVGGMCVCVGGWMGWDGEGGGGYRTCCTVIRQSLVSVTQAHRLGPESDESDPPDEV